ncbi:uncharacterized protein LOC134228452 isoform X1 [Saccostrea cucullata]|uniref:uncharacterized protein LOC134228452 isoform X1 n=1 Tax=Saccostrea cuccullata TaxID=36930 RepID=UPI002ED13325
MATEIKIVIWTILLAMQCINSCKSQTLYSDKTTCSEADEIKSLKDQTAFLKQLVSNQAIEMEMLKKELNSVKEAMSTLMPDHVAFHVVASSNSSPGVVIFDHVISNIGSGYDITSGIFTVPTTGFYIFSWSIETYGQLTEAALLVNGLEMGISKSDEAPSYYDTTISFAVLSLTRKDKVWVRVKSGRAEAMHTMFSGWMINKSDSTAFYAFLSRDVSGSRIIFNNETLDTHDAYSTYTGTFVAPRSGLYVFMMSGLIYGSYEFSCKFVFSNGNSQPEVWVDSTNGRYDSSSYMTFAWMNSGDYVYIGAQRMNATSMFAGWLLMDDTNVSKSTYPAFLAYLIRDSSRTPVVYDVAVGSYHHGYSTSTGVFTADRDGLYLFLSNTEAYKEIVRTVLTVNGVGKFETRADGRRTGYDDSSAVTVLRLSSNDQVNIVIKTGTVNEVQSLFLGIFIFEI